MKFTFFFSLSIFIFLSTTTTSLTAQRNRVKEEKVMVSCEIRHTNDIIDVLDSLLAGSGMPLRDY